MLLVNLLLLVGCGMVGIAYTFFRKFARRPLGIYDLPLELLAEIASHLDFIDVISLRQSTRKLREATEARVVWHSLAQKYSARHFNLPRPENGTINTLATNDLRKWIWPRLEIDQIWRKKTAVPTKRFFSMHKDSSRLQFLPGGRWLLAARRTGHLYFYDLDSKEPTPRLLLGPSPGKEEERPNRFVFDVNRGAPVLDVTLAISATGSIRFENPCFGWLHIQQVCLVGSGESATLSARKLTSIPHIRRDATTSAIALCGDLVTRSVFEGQNIWIEVFRWRECTPTELQVAIIRVSETMQGGTIFLIGEDRILCIASHRIFIHRIPPLFRLLVDWDREVGYEGGEDATEPIWSYDSYNKKLFQLRNVPRFYFDGSASYRLIVQDTTAFRSHPYFFEITSTGLYKGCGINIRFGYGWDDPTGVNFINKKSEERPNSGQLFFDEETGRYLLWETQAKAWVFDFIVP